MDSKDNTASNKTKMFNFDMIKNYVSEKEEVVEDDIVQKEGEADQTEQEKIEQLKNPLTDDELQVVKDKIIGTQKYDEAEMQALKPVELRALSIFFQKNSNVDLLGRIKDTDYAFYRLNKDKIAAVIQFIEQNKGTGPGMPQISQNEIREYRFGAVRNSKIPYLKYNHDQHKNQYGKLADFIIDYCQSEMRDFYKLKEVFVPENDVLDKIENDLAQGQPFPEDKKADREPKCNIFMSPEFYKPSPEQKALNKQKTALVLIQGTGAVRAGIWARSVCNNTNFELGSALPQVEWAIMNEYPVIVMNPNFNKVDGKDIPLNISMDAHAYHVWDEYVESSGFENILIIAHSAGGGCLTTIQREFADTFYQKVKKIAYTDSWTIQRDQINEEQLAFMQKNAVHYEGSDEPLGTPLEDTSMLGSVCPRVSAGHEKHEFTTGCAWPLIMQQFDKIKEDEINKAVEQAKKDK